MDEHSILHELFIAYVLILIVFIIMGISITISIPRHGTGFYVGVIIAGIIWFLVLFVLSRVFIVRSMYLKLKREKSPI